MPRPSGGIFDLDAKRERLTEVVRELARVVRTGGRVVVVDRAHPPIDKACGEGLMLKFCLFSSGPEFMAKCLAQAAAFRYFGSLP